MHVRRAMRHLDACHPARVWLMDFAGGDDPMRAFESCPSGLWLAWSVGAVWSFGGVTTADVLLSAAAVTESVLGGAPADARAAAELAVEFARAVAAHPDARFGKAAPVDALSRCRSASPERAAARALVSMAALAPGETSRVSARAHATFADRAARNSFDRTGVRSDGRALAEKVRACIDPHRLLAGIAFAYEEADRQGAPDGETA